MKKLIIEEIPDSEGNITKIRISEQTDIVNNFGKNGPEFTFNGFTMKSCNLPQISPSIFFVRGTNKAADNVVLSIPSLSWLIKMRDAVKAYNEYFKGCKHCISRHCNYCTEQS